MRIAQASDGKSCWIEESEGRDWRIVDADASRMFISWII
jgi:hypothetical protein